MTAVQKFPASGWMDTKKRGGALAIKRRIIVDRRKLTNRRRIYRKQSADRRSNAPRRKGADPLVRSLNWITLTAWVLLFVAIIFLGFARPGSDTFFDRYYRICLRSTWDDQLVTFYFVVMLLNFVVSSIGLFMNSRRMKRSTDEYRLSLIAVLLLSFLGILVYVLFL